MTICGCACMYIQEDISIIVQEEAPTYITSKKKERKKEMRITCSSMKCSHLKVFIWVKFKYYLEIKT